MEIPSVCRCCLSSGLVKNLYTSYVWLDKNEIYSDMLQECFNIVLSKSENGSICESCIKQLRGALRFKEQVQLSEQEFLRQLQSNAEHDKIKPQMKVCFHCKTIRKIVDIGDTDKCPDCDQTLTKCLTSDQLTGGRLPRQAKKRQNNGKQTKADGKPFEVKLEPKQESDGGDDSDDYFIADAVRQVPVQVIKPERPEARRALRRKPLQKDGERARKTRTLVNRRATNSCELPNITTLKPKEMNRTVKSDRKQNDPLDPISSTSRVKIDKRKHMDNLQTILKYSNAVPFKNKSLLGFLCGYCEEPFPDPADLRLHTEKDHNKERLEFKSSIDTTHYNVKLHVGDLNCTLCDEKMDNLNVLKTHLVKSHNKTIYNDIKDHILQFKLKKGDVYDCALCTSTYETFKMLKQHMNKHYANYTCKKCDASFTLKRSLNSHQTTHQEGSHKCQYCDRVFPSTSKRHHHVKTMHLGSRSISNCPFCNEPFRSYYQRNQHLVKVHNSEAQYKCNVCDKGYILKSLLMHHIKKTHLMEMNYQCTECGYKFFTKKALNAHMVKHTGERNYSCEVCHKCYARKDTLREHMRIHNNDRRFKCDVCDITFVQKCRLRSHLLSNHGISMAASDIASTDRD